MLVLDGESLDVETVRPVVRGDPMVFALAPSAIAAVRRAREVLDAIPHDRPIYGINTGFGRLAGTRIPEDGLRTLQRNLLLSHACGVGPPLPDGVVRLAQILRVNALARGNSGVRLELIERLLGLLNAGILPVVPEKGSVGASGDLAPLAHMALVLIGEGEARLQGVTIPAATALRQKDLPPFVLAAKEGLSLINGTQVSQAIGIDALLRALDLARVADIAAAMTLDALRGSATPFDPRVALVRPHPGHAVVATNLRALIAGSAILASHAGCGRVQDAYSLRCVPQVHGAVRDALAHLRTVLEREMNSATDNPLVFSDDGDVVSAGNFHGEPLALPLDYAAAAVSELGAIAERRVESLVNPDLSGLPPFLVEDSGMNSGLMIPQVVAAALASENKSLAHPASVDSIPTSAGREDHVSMAPIAARHLAAIADNVASILAIELFAASTALPFHRPLRSSPAVERALEVVSAAAPRLTADRWLAPDLRAVRRIIDDGSLVAAVEETIGPLA